MGRDKYRFALLKYMCENGWMGSVHRVAPCLKEKIKDDLYESYTVLHHELKSQR